MAFCPQCGAQLRDDAVFCSVCGTPLNNAQGGVAPGPAPMQQQYYYEPKVGIFTIYGRAFNVLRRKPITLWGISLLSGLISGVLTLLFGIALGIGICISMLISVGMTMVYLHGYRGEEVHTIQLFDAFKDLQTIKRVLGGTAWTAMWTFLWALIPIVGPIFAIIRTYEYRLVPYILVTEPDIPCTEAKNVSKERTKGWKGKMFGADILFIVLVGVVSGVLLLLAKIPYVGILFGIISIIVSIIVSLFYNLFMGIVQAAWYEEITSRI